MHSTLGRWSPRLVEYESGLISHRHVEPAGTASFLVTDRT